MKKMDKFSNKRAFSLAEILITLSIIGVIAAMTIPGLVSDTNDAELHVAWRKTFAEISQATMMAKAQYGDIDFTSDLTMRDSYENVMRFTKQDMWKNIASPFYTWYKNTSNQGITYSSDATPSAVLSSGSLIRFYSYGNNSGNGICSVQLNNLTGMCGYMYVDVNGKKGPNMFGKDFYSAWIVKKNGGYVAYSMGSSGDGKTCQKGSIIWNTSDGCSALTLRTDNMP